MNNSLSGTELIFRHLPGIVGNGKLVKIRNSSETSKVVLNQLVSDNTAQAEEDEFNFRLEESFQSAGNTHDVGLAVYQYDAGSVMINLAGTLNEAIKVSADGLMYVREGGVAVGAMLDDVMKFWNKQLIMKDPLVLDFDNNLQLINPSKSPVYVNVDGGDFATHMGWMGPNEAMLVVDNGDGRVTTDEIMGFNSGNGYQELVSFDSNQDGILTRGELQDIRLWIDANGDGVSDFSELHGFNYWALLNHNWNLDIVSIDLTHFTTSWTNNGNRITGYVELNLADGTTRKIYDVLYALDRSETVFVGEVPYDAWMAVQDLPHVWGGGEVADLRIAAALDPILKAMVEDFVAASKGPGVTLDAFMAQAYEMGQAIALRLAGTEDVDPTSRGAYGDARFIEAIEKFTGVPIDATGLTTPGVTNPNLSFQAMADYAWGTLVQNLVARMLIQGELGQEIPVIYNVEKDRFESSLTIPQAIQAFEALDDGLVSHGDKVKFWSVAIKILDGLYETSKDASSGIPFDGYYESSLEAALNNAGIGVGYPASTRGILRKPVSIDSENLFERSSGDFFIQSSDLDTSIKLWGGGNHIILTGAGDDTVTLGLGSRFVDLGAGNNTLNLAIGTSPQTIDMATGTSVSTSYTTKFTNVQNISGGSGNDIIYGDDDDNVLAGGGGADQLHGGGGNDIIYMYNRSGGPQSSVTPLSTAWGGDGNDTIYGSNGRDFIYGGAGDDMLYGNAGNDYLDGGAGNNIINGGDHANTSDNASRGDTAGYRGATSGIVMTGSTVQNGYGGTDTLIGIEKVEGSVHGDYMQAGDSWTVLAGMEGDDILIGGAAADFLLGGSGNDTLNGGAGNDKLSGGSGINTLTGGAGKDIFYIQVPLGGLQIITDYTPGQDAIQVYAPELDGKSGWWPGTQWERTSDGQSHFVIGPDAQATSVDWQFILNTNTGDLYLDVDGIGAKEAYHIAVLEGATNLNGIIPMVSLNPNEMPFQYDF